jgi:murein L,D-transpeptidase YcbB/YkuD
MPRILYSTVVALLLMTFATSPLRAGDTLAAALAELAQHGELRVGPARVRNSALLQQFYAVQAQRPLWTDPAARANLLVAVQGAQGDGLRPADYHLAALLTAPPDQAAETRGMDLVRSDALIRLASHYFRGKLDPLSVEAEIDLHSPELGADAIALLAEAVASGDIPGTLERLAPQNELYRGLKRGLARYRDIADRGGWPAIPDGPTLRPGERSPRVTLLRQRLLASGDLAADTGADPELYDPLLEAAVRHFQARHLLAVDAAVGKRTLAAANVSVDARIDQIRVNLERARWLLHDLPPTHVLVDIAGFEVRYVRDGVELLRSRATVGRPYRKTPIFRAAIRYLEFNPTWTVPPTILTNDVLPEIRKNLGYLAKRQMRVLTFDGRAVDPATVDWRRYSGKNLPYLIRQDPGPKNALGQVKFMFPNAHSVYLHDTPERKLFLQPERAFSSGCIRVEEARRLALLLLEAEGRSEAEVEALFADVRTRRVPLARPVPILLYYWTVAIEDDGDVLFKRDLYDRDAGLLAALDTTDGD